MNSLMAKVEEAFQELIAAPAKPAEPEPASLKDCDPIRVWSDHPGVDL